jgi:hypothetical protein
MTANPSQASSVSEPNGCDLHPDKGYAWCEDCNAAWSVWAQNRIQSLTAEKAALVEQVRVRTELLAEMRSWPSIRAAIAGHTLEQRLNAALNDASGAINREG